MSVLIVTCLSAAGCPHARPATPRKSTRSSHRPFGNRIRGDAQADKRIISSAYVSGVNITRPSQRAACVYVVNGVAIAPGQIYKAGHVVRTPCCMCAPSETTVDIRDCDAGKLIQYRHCVMRMSSLSMVLRMYNDYTVIRTQRDGWGPRTRSTI